jgi:hypothetical protein
MNIKKLLFLLLLMPVSMTAWHSIKLPSIKSLEVITNHDFEALPIIKLGGDDKIDIGFDEMSHDYRRFVCHLEPCQPDWTPNEELFESEWLEGINDQPIDDYENSINTTTLYTHYSFQFPNEQMKVRMSGNYRLHIIDEDQQCDALVVEFRVLESLMNVNISVDSNTDIDTNKSHQQVSMRLNYNGITITRPDEQIQTFVMQNGREDNMKINIQPTSKTPQGLLWEHSMPLIFEAGNEYHKFEILDPTHTTMGLESVSWDEATRSWHATPTPCRPRRYYEYDEDANGAFLLRNSDNYEAERTSEYVYVHYHLQPAPAYDNAQIIINGRWTTEPQENYQAIYDPDTQSYNLTVLQKLGYYNYLFLIKDIDGTTHMLPEEGSFYQTENTYQTLVYYKGITDRAWRLAAFQELTFKP